MDCVECGDREGEISGSKFDIDGKMCNPCYQRHYQRNLRASDTETDLSDEGQIEREEIQFFLSDHQGEKSHSIKSVADQMGMNYNQIYYRVNKYNLDESGESSFADRQIDRMGNIPRSEWGGGLEQVCREHQLSPVLAAWYAEKQGIADFGDPPASLRKEIFSDDEDEKSSRRTREDLPDNCPECGEDLDSDTAISGEPFDIDDRICRRCWNQLLRDQGFKEDHLTEEELEQREKMARLYQEEGMTMGEIGEEIGKSQEQVQYRFYKYGIPRRNPGERASS